MPLRDIRDLEPFDPTIRDTLGLPPAGSGGNTINPTGGSIFPPSGNWPWPEWAKAIDSISTNWRTLEDGNLLHKRSNKVYAPSGTFISSLQEYLDGLIPEDDGLPNEGAPSDQYAGLVRRNGAWYDPKTNQYYNDQYQKIKDPSVIPFPGAAGADQGSYTGNPNPSDGPIPNQGSDGFPSINISPNWDPKTGNFIGLPPPTNAQGGAGQGPANPMPGMPTTGVARNSPYLGISRASGTPVGQREAFKPWGNPLGYLSQALRYGGAPEQYLMGGYEGMDAATAAAQAAALRG